MLFKNLTFLGFQRLLPLWMEIHCWFDVSVVCVQNFYNLVQMNLCIIAGGLVLKFSWCVWLWGCLFVLFHHTQINISSCLNISDMKFCEWSSFSKKKWKHKVLWFLSNYSKLRTHGKYNRHKKVKHVFNIHVSNKFDIWFWCCWWMNNCIFDKANLKGYWECLVFSFFLCMTLDYFAEGEKLWF